jgi:hypothetical protein
MTSISLRMLLNCFAFYFSRFLFHCKSHQRRQLNPSLCPSQFSQPFFYATQKLFQNWIANSGSSYERGLIDLKLWSEKWLDSSTRQPTHNSLTHETFNQNSCHFLPLSTVTNLNIYFHYQVTTVQGSKNGKVKN